MKRLRLSVGVANSSISLRSKIFPRFCINQAHFFSYYVWYVESKWYVESNLFATCRLHYLYNIVHGANNCVVINFIMSYSVVTEFPPKNQEASFTPRLGRESEEDPNEDYDNKLSQADRL